MIEIEGVRPSAEIRADLAAEGRPVLLAFSCGKDALAAWLAMRDDAWAPASVKRWTGTAWA